MARLRVVGAPCALRDVSVWGAAGASRTADVSGAAS